MVTMKKLLLTTACMMALVAPGHANFAIRGVMYGLMATNNGQTPTCSQYAKWVKSHPNKREIMDQWILGFYSGVESQMAQEPEYAKATGSERPKDAILGTVSAFCKQNPKQQVLAIIPAMVGYDLTESIKHHDPRYQHGFNVHGVLATYTCQNLTMETDGELSSNGFTMKAPTSSDRKFLLEEWILGAASGIEAQALRGKPHVTKASNDEFLDSIYATCRANPTAYVFSVVLEQELANVEAVSEVVQSGR
jgi:hypothetical protein